MARKKIITIDARGHHRHREPRRFTSRATCNENSYFIVCLREFLGLVPLGSDFQNEEEAFWQPCVDLDSDSLGIEGCRQVSLERFPWGKRSC